MPDIEFLKQLTLGVVYFMLSSLPIAFYTYLFIYYRPQLKRKLDDSTAIYLVLLLPVIILLIGINDWAFEYGSELDQSGLLVIGLVGVVVFTLCFIGQKEKELKLLNDGSES